MTEPTTEAEARGMPGPTQGVALLLGDPKKAIIALSGPMVVAMLLMSTYNIVNAIWAFYREILKAERSFIQTHRYWA